MSEYTKLGGPCPSCGLPQVNRAAKCPGHAGCAYVPFKPATTLTDGSPVTHDHREIDTATGQQKAYVVLSAEERAKGFMRPVRRSYVHEKCGSVTTMGLALAETYAREPSFYSGTFCVGCHAHFPVGADGEFVWDGATEKVGT